MSARTNSELDCFRACERKHDIAYRRRRTGLIPVESLTRGTRIHDCLAHWWDHGLANDGASLPPIEKAMIVGYAALYQAPHLRNVRVNVPFRVTIGGVDMVGEVDALGEDDEGLVIVEHKTTASDISPGSVWWQEAAISPQDTLYIAAFPGARLLKDVLKVPDLEQKKATPEDKRKYTKPTKKEPESRLYAGQRDTDETDEEYIARVLADMAEEPGKYFQRTMMVRTEAERDAYAEDIASLDVRMAVADTSDYHPRNPRACFAYGRHCEFFDACWNGKPIESYPQVERNHSEDVTRFFEKEAK